MSNISIFVEDAMNRVSAFQPSSLLLKNFSQWHQGKKPFLCDTTENGLIINF